MNIESGQNIFDVATQEFGTLEELFSLLQANGLGPNSKLKAGQDLVINKINVGDEDVKDFISFGAITMNNDQGENLPPIISGDFNNDFDESFG